MTDTNMTDQEMELWNNVFAALVAQEENVRWDVCLKLADDAVRMRRGHFGDQPAPAACDDETRDRQHEFGAMLSDIRTFCLMQLKTHGLDTQQTTLQLVCELAREREMFRVSCNHKGKRLKEMEPLVDAISKIYPSGSPTNEMSRILLAAAEKFRSEGWESHDPINPSK